MLFATRKIITCTAEGTFNRERTIAAGLGKDGGDRVLRCIGGPSCIAKNRYWLLCRKTKHLQRKERIEIIESLQSTGEVTEQRVQTKGAPQVTYRAG